MTSTSSASRRTSKRGSGRRTRSCLALFGAFAIAALVLATASTAHAQSRSLDIREMNAQIVVSRSGSVTVTERFVVQFNGSWNGIYRSIPLEYPAPGGLNYTLRLRIVSVTDDSGNSLRHEVDRVGDSRRVKMWVPGAENATRTIVLTYRTDNALRFFEDHDELYWNVTGEEWDFPIQNVTAVVMLPDSVTGLRTSSFTGARGSTEAAPVEQVGTTFTFRGTRPLGYREGLTIVVGWKLARLLRDREAERADQHGTLVDLDVKVIAAVDPDVDEAVGEEGMRADLFERLSQVRIDVPPLRRRREDVPVLTVLFLRDACDERGIAPKAITRSALKVLTALPWHGNARELRAFVDTLARAVDRPVVQLEDVLDHARFESTAVRMDVGLSLREAKARFERECISAVLARHHGRVGEAARALGIQRTNLYRKVRQLQVARPRAVGRRGR
jgi:hypothetical protein